MLVENNSYPEDGRVRREANTLTAAGYHVTVISPGEHGQPWRETVGATHAYRYPAPPDANGLLGYLLEYGYSMVAAFLLSLVVLMREGFDVIHAHNPPDTFVLIAAIYRPFGKQFVFDHHDLAPELYYHARFSNGNRFIYRLLLGFERLTCRLADHVIATNESYKAIEMERCGVPEHKISIVRNAPDFSRMHPAGPDPDLRVNVGTLIGYVGVTGFQDGIDYLLRALWCLAHELQRDDFYCLIMGDGDALTYLKHLTAELGLEGYVGFTGWLSGADVVHYLSTVDIGVSPDPSNPYNDRCTMIKLTEYMALAKPIVAFDLPEHRFTARDAAVYARPNDELDFARKIALLMDDPARRADMGRLGLQRIRSELSWEQQEKRLLAAYASLETAVAARDDAAFDPEPYQHDDARS